MDYFSSGLVDITDPERQEDRDRCIKRIQEEFESLPHFSKKLDEFIYNFARQRILEVGHASRSYFVQKVAEYILPGPWEKRHLDLVTGLALIAELATCVTYLENHILDEKFDVKNHKRRVETLLNAQILKGLIKDYIANDMGLNPQKTTYLQKCVNKIWVDFAKGEYIDKFLMNFRSFKNSSKDLHSCWDKDTNDRVQVDEYIDIISQSSNYTFIIDRLEYLKTYFTRTYLINTSLYENIVKAILFLTDEDEKNHRPIIKFARNYGVIQQLINDNSDFIPESWLREKKLFPNSKFTLNGKLKIMITRGKFPEDTFADMRDGLVTLPIIFHLSNKRNRNSYVYKYYQNYNGFLVKSIDQVEVLKSLLVKYPDDSSKHSDIIKAKKFVSLIAKDSVKAIENIKGPNPRWILDLLRIAWLNKFYRIYNNPRKNFTIMGEFFTPFEQDPQSILLIIRKLYNKMVTLSRLFVK